MLTREFQLALIDK